MSLIRAIISAPVIEAPDGLTAGVRGAIYSMMTTMTMTTTRKGGAANVD